MIENQDIYVKWHLSAFYQDIEQGLSFKSAVLSFASGSRFDIGHQLVTQHNIIVE